MSNAELAMSFNNVELADAPIAHSAKPESMVVAVVALVAAVAVFLAAVIFAPSFLVVYGSVAAITYVLGIFKMCLGIVSSR